MCSFLARNANQVRALLIAALSIVATATVPAPATADHGGALQAAIADVRAEPTTVDGLVFEVDMATLSAFYAKRRDQPLWLDDGPADARTLIDILNEADREGLQPEDYRPDHLSHRLTVAETPHERAKLELLLSGMLLRYSTDLRRGRLSPQQINPTFPAKAPGPTPLAYLEGAAEARDLATYFDQLAPATPIYRQLRRALHSYREIAANGGWPELPADRLDVGMEDPQVAALRQRLKAEGDISIDSTPSNVFDAGLEQAVKRFQQRHGLEPDGIVGPKTYNALNVRVETRIQQILVNMERWRWMPDDLGERYLLVNLAGFEVELVAHGTTQLRMRAVVGKPYRKTPVFSDKVTYLDFNPTWTIPPTILKEDILPKLRQNPDYLAQENMTLYAGWSADAPALDPHTIDWASADPEHLPYRIVQEPGPKNPLGRVKFMFPNRYHVYLHDSPAQGLFDKAVRTLSSGCIRVEKPVELAAALLNNKPSWDRAKVEEVMQSSARERVLLDDPVPVHLTYSTVWIGEGGTVQFRDDVYGRDLLLAQSLFERAIR